jgi:hypothetical protein
MRHVPVATAAIFSLSLSLLLSTVSAASAERGASSRLNPCAAPNEVGSSFEETAWQIWVAATCPVNGDQYPFTVWENWIEQSRLFPTDPSKGLKVPNAGSSTAEHIVHASPLTLALDPGLTTSVPSGLLGSPNPNCNKAKNPPPGQPGLIICEEVRLNGAAEDYIAGTNLWNRTSQAHAAANGDDIQFPRPAAEVKVDWTLLNSIIPGADCNNPNSLPSEFTTHPVHLEMINGNCYAMTGIHVMSKLIDKWIWATFEPQNSITNPNRCKDLGCLDPFGSRPAKSNGRDTRLSQKLEQLMYAANLAPEWKNYRLDGVQTDYFSPKLLSNSIIEGENGGIPANQASCITCHALSSVKSDGTDGITLLNPNARPVGFPLPLPSKDWIRRDFVWSLLLACPGANSHFNACAP